MSENMNDTQNTEQGMKSYFPEYVDTIFKRVDPQDVEQFYKSYQLWSLQPRVKVLHVEIEALQQAIASNDELLQKVHPSAISLASLAQLQASGVENIDLLDRMLARGEDWLDYIMQLLKHCEELDVIGGDYTQWCEHALEGAYDWIASMSGTENGSEISLLVDRHETELDSATEEQLLQKLMSEDEETMKLPVIGCQFKKITPAPANILLEEVTSPNKADKIVPASEIADTAKSVPVSTKITRDLAVFTESIEQARDITKVEEPFVPDEVVTKADKESVSTQKTLPAKVRQKGFRNFLPHLLAKVWRG